MRDSHLGRVVYDFNEDAQERFYAAQMKNSVLSSGHRGLGYSSDEIPSLDHATCSARRSRSPSLASGLQHRQTDTTPQNLQSHTSMRKPSPTRVSASVIDSIRSKLSKPQMGMLHRLACLFLLVHLLFLFDVPRRAFCCWLNPPTYFSR